MGIEEKHGKFLFVKTKWHLARELPQKVNMDESHYKIFLKDEKLRTIFDIKENKKETVICFIKAAVLSASYVCIWRIRL